MSAASEITRRAKSNLAFALRILSREQRRDMCIFYAFCRTIDDLADNPSIPRAEREYELTQWKNHIISALPGTNELQAELLEIRKKHQLPHHLLIAIIEGCEMDLQRQRFQTWDDLSNYIWKVACAVGLVSTRILGCHGPAAESYATALANGLQLTNILRDIREDVDNGLRLYLPLDDLARFELTEQDFASRVYDSRFLALMHFQAERAQCFFAEAAAYLSASDRYAMRPARIMGDIYQLLLNDMRRDQFQVYTKRYRISRLRKMMVLSKHLIALR